MLSEENFCLVWRYLLFALERCRLAESGGLLSSGRPLNRDELCSTEELDRNLPCRSNVVLTQEPIICDDKIEENSFTTRQSIN